MTVDPTLHLSTAEEVRLPLRWIALLRDHLSCSLAATSGVHSYKDAVKLLLAGADVTMMASALYLHGPEHLTAVLDGTRIWPTVRLPWPTLARTELGVNLAAVATG